MIGVRRAINLSLPLQPRLLSLHLGHLLPLRGVPLRESITLLGIVDFLVVPRYKTVTVTALCWGLPSIVLRIRRQGTSPYVAVWLDVT